MAKNESLQVQGRVRTIVNKINELHALIRGGYLEKVNIVNDPDNITFLRKVKEFFETGNLAGKLNEIYAVVVEKEAELTEMGFGKLADLKALQTAQEQYLKGIIANDPALVSGITPVVESPPAVQVTL